MQPMTADDFKQELTHIDDATRLFMAFDDASVRIRAALEERELLVLAWNAQHQPPWDMLSLDDKHSLVSGIEIRAKIAEQRRTDTERRPDCREDDMQPMTLDEFKGGVQTETVHQSVTFYCRIVAALEEREGLLKVRGLLLAGSSESLTLYHERPYGTDTHEEDAYKDGLRVGIERALEWAQGLFADTERRPDCRDTDQPGGKPAQDAP